MAQVPAFCDNCGNAFITSNFIDGDANVSLKNVVISCPNCGSIAKVPDGIYQFIGDTIKILSAPYSSYLKIQRLTEILQRAKEKKASAKETSKIIEEELPEFSGIAQYLKQQTPTIVIGVIQILLGIIQIHLASQQMNNPTPIVPQQVINQTFNINSPNSRNVKKQFSNNPVTKKKMPINALCYCESGRKYKKCHGAKGK